MKRLLENIQYPFSSNIPWKLNNGIIVPKISRDVFLRIKEKAKGFYAICPGYLLESMIASKANDMFIRSGIRINKWIMPNCYARGLSLFDFKYKGSSGNMFSEYRRIKQAVDSYPSPIFMDEDSNVYFNLLFNYGTRVNYENSKAVNDSTPFWKQILRNTCLIDNYECKSFNDLYFEDNDFLIANGIDVSKRFVCIDNSNLFGIPSHGMKIKSAFIFPEQARDIAGYLFDKNIQCVIMTNDRKGYYGKNLFTIDPWNKIDLLNLLSLFKSSYGVMSSDPNVYLVAAMVGCNRVLCNDEAIAGWRFDDLDGLCEVSENCFSLDSPSVDDIIKFFK